MHLLEKIYQSRNTLRTILDNEWNTEDIQDLSIKELEIMYKTDNMNNYISSGCNFTLTHKYIPSHKLRIIYYNFPELHRKATKINKTCCDKLISLYKKEGFEDENTIFDPEDSLLVIINDTISESIGKSVESMYHKGQNELLHQDLSPNILKEIKSSKFNVGKSYFRNIHIFNIDTLVVNLLNHSLVPKHEVIRTKEEIQKIYEQTNSNSELLPIILRTDPIAKLIRLSPGDICKITRMGQTSGSNIYYRICK